MAIRRALGAMGALALITGQADEAWAGAWTLPQGTGLLIESLWGWIGAGAPWGGNPAVKQNKVEAQTYVEYGLTDNLTIFGQAALERYALSPPQENVYTGLDYSDLGLRAKLWSSGEWVFSGEATAFVPGARNPNAPAQSGDTGGAAEGRLLAGGNVTVGPWPGFVDLEAGYRLRTAGPPDEWHADATFGLKPYPGLMFMLQDFTTVSSASTNRNFPAWRTSVAEASAVLALGGRWSLQIGLFTSLFAVRTNSQHGVNLALWRTF
jgi:protein XagA